MREFILAEADKDYWRGITRSFGSTTRDLDQAYIALTLKDDGRVLATTNYLRAGYVNAPVLQFNSEGLEDESTFSDFEQHLLGASNETGLRRVRLKILLDGDVNSPLFERTVFDRRDQTFKFPTDETPPLNNPVKQERINLAAAPRFSVNGLKGRLITLQEQRQLDYGLEFADERMAADWRFGAGGAERGAV